MGSTMTLISLIQKHFCNHVDKRILSVKKHGETIDWGGNIVNNWEKTWICNKCGKIIKEDGFISFNE